MRRGNLARFGTSSNTLAAVLCVIKFKTFTRNLFCKRRHKNLWLTLIYMLLCFYKLKIHLHRTHIKSGEYSRFFDKIITFHVKKQEKQCRYTVEKYIVNGPDREICQTCHFLLKYDSLRSI